LSLSSFFQFGSNRDTYCICYSSVFDKFWTYIFYKAIDSNEKAIMIDNFYNHGNKNTYDCWISDGVITCSSITFKNTHKMCSIFIAVGLMMIMIGTISCGKPHKMHHK
jgi:hypothetical protein